MTVRERQASVRARRKKRGRRLMVAYALRGAILLLLALVIILNEYSRPGIALSEVNGVVVHYTGDPGTTAEQEMSASNRKRCNMSLHKSKDAVPILLCAVSLLKLSQSLLPPD